MQYSSYIQPIIGLAVDAGDILMKHWGTGLSVDIKADNSPVTQADIEADNLISAGLRKLTPNIPVISEEGNNDNIPHTNTYWLVDPLDGTRSFIKGDRDFTVNIGLVVNNRAKFGVIYAPAHGLIYHNNERAAYVQPAGTTTAVQINVSTPDMTKGFRVLASKNHQNKLTEDYIRTLKVDRYMPAASSYKFCLLAEGKADIYPRFGNTMQWDTAAGQAILEAAGGNVVLADGGEFLYKFNHLDINSLKNPHFIAKNF